MIGKLVGMGLCVLSLAGCAAQEPRAGEQEVRLGKIARIESVMLESDRELGVGAILGGIAGGVLGHQIGSGTGNTVATVAGALGGAYAGKKAQDKYGERKPGQHILVNLDNGVTVGITQPVDSVLRVGDAVMIEGSGEDARVRRR
jgi:outer membrane lipoprotein SlyB